MMFIRSSLCLQFTPFVILDVTKAETKGHSIFRKLSPFDGDEDVIRYRPVLKLMLLIFSD